MIGNEEEERDTGQRTKMVAKQRRRLDAIRRKEGMGEAIKQAAEDIVTLKIELARAQLVKPTKLDDGKRKPRSATKGIRG